MIYVLAVLVALYLAKEVFFVYNDNDFVLNGEDRIAISNWAILRREKVDISNKSFSEIYKIGYNSDASPTPKPGPSPIIVNIETQLDAETRKWRVKNKLKNLENNVSMCDLAEIRLNQMHEEFSHRLFYEEASLIQKKNVHLGIIGENLYSGPVYDKDYIFGLWLNSPKHKDNIAGNYDVDCVKCDYGFCVHTFAQIFPD